MAGCYESLPQALGTWTLLVDPTLGYMVREATFVYPLKNKPDHVVKTIGIKSNGACMYPDSGSLTLLLGDMPITYTITFQSVTLKKDSDLYASVEKQFAAPLPPNTDFHDHIVEPPTHVFVQSDGKIYDGKSNDGRDPTEMTSNSSEKPRSRWFLFLAVSLAIASAILGIILFQRYQRRRLIER